MSDPILTVDNVSTGYGKIEVLHNVSLTVSAGEIVTIIGANGAGKTTTLATIAGLKAPRSGKVRFKGEEITGYKAHDLVSRGLALVPEGREIFPRLTVLENLELGAYLRRGQNLKADFNRAFDLFPVLRDRQSQMGGTLSGGEQQMLAIARALMSRPTLLLMDEPSMGVAPLLTKRIFDTISSLNREGLTILLVEQNAHLALKIASRGYVLETGSITLEDSSTNLLNNKCVADAYLGA